MANTSTPRGFVPLRPVGSSPNSGGAAVYYRGTGDANNLFIGDPVAESGTGDAFGIPGVQRATAGSAGYVKGVVAAIVNNSSDNLSRSYLPASIAGYVIVVDDPNMEYEIQEDSVGGALAVTQIGLNADFIFGSGSTTTGLSACQLDSSTADTTNTLQCRILGIVERPNNEIGANAKWRVRFNLRNAYFTTGA